jgi:hypothetical protein
MLLETFAPLRVHVNHDIIVNLEIAAVQKDTFVDYGTHYISCVMNNVVLLISLRHKCPICASIRRISLRIKPKFSQIFRSLVKTCHNMVRQCTIGKQLLRIKPKFSQIFRSLLKTCPNMVRQCTIGKQLLH